MFRNRVTYCALGAFIFAASCAREAAEPDVIDWGDGKIYFRSSLSDVRQSRAQDMTLENLESFRVTCFNSADIYTDSKGFLSPYFEDATFIRRLNSPTVTTYVSSPDEQPRDWPANSGLLRFFAFSPSINEMVEGTPLPEGEDAERFFRLRNRTLKDGEDMTVDYRLGAIRVNPDISRQFDFVTAEAAGERWRDFTGGVDLAFSHQLCQVELRAWGSGEENEFEIAGVRIGNPEMEGDFIFADDNVPDPGVRWDIPDRKGMEKVEYLFRSSRTALAGRPDSFDRIFTINSNEHNTAQAAASIMGNGGCAMVIPTRNPKWEGLADPDIATIPYSTERMYFSILTRVTDRATGTLIYPYPGNPYGMTVVSLALDRTGRVMARVYAGETEGTYFTDPELRNPYMASVGVEVKDFGWAAVPVDADWSAGKRYVYTLNYSEGIGLHDPEDPEPGKPIAGQSSSISWSVGVESWSHAEENGEYVPDLNVPEN